eukprot:jgi/Chrzof1/13374/Cz07g30190.t1
MPFGQMPILEHDGKKLAQSAAIDQYCAKLAGLLPDDPWVAAVADQAYCFRDEVGLLFRSTVFHIQDPEERLRKNQEIVAGPLKEKLNMLQDKILVSQYSV